MKASLLIVTIVLFGVSAFFRKLAVDKISPYQLQLYSSIIYTSLIPFWLYMTEHSGSEISYDTSAIIFGIVCVLTSVTGSIFFGKLLQSSDSIGSLTVLIAINPIVTFLLSMMFLGETLTIKKVIACGLAIISLIVFHI